jgi:hypothetical protein
MPKSSDSNKRTSRAELALIVLSLCFFTIHSVYAARVNSVTADEYVHLPAGIAILQTGDLELDHTGSPPMRAVPALAALTAKPAMDYSSAHWLNRETYGFSWLFMANNFALYQQLYFLPRLLTACFALLLALFVFLAARAVAGVGAGARAGALAVFLLCFNPEILAHAPLVTVDVLTACFFLPRFIFSSDSSKRPARLMPLFSA